MQQESMSTKSSLKTPIKRAVAAATGDTALSIDRVVEGVRETVTGIDTHPLAFVRENPIRATAVGFFIGMIVGSALSKRAVTR